MKLRSTVFELGSEIPKKFSCEGDDISPPLEWENLPLDTQFLALICEDPDAPLKTFIHWVIYNIPAMQKGLREAVPTEAVLRGGIKQGQNSFGRIGYGGPCPPNGPYHRYYFTLFALDQELVLKGGETKQEIEQAMQGHVLGTAEFMGRYRKVRLRTFARTLLGR